MAKWLRQWTVHGGAGLISTEASLVMVAPLKAFGITASVLQKKLHSLSMHLGWSRS